MSGDKSISQRIVMLGALLDHDLKVENFLVEIQFLQCQHRKGGV